jgi:hypothetical protein
MIGIKAFITHKQAETKANCHDVYAIDTENATIAVADGVSQSIFPRQWAELLTGAYVADRSFRLDSDECVAPLRKRWRAWFAERLEARRAAGDPMTPYLEQFYVEERSAGATFLGVRIEDAHTAAYEALGDTCLIVVRGGAITEVVGSSEDGFDDFPEYIDSHPRRGKGTPRMGTVGDLATGDRLLLVTDALAARLDAARQSVDCVGAFVEAINGLASQRDFVRLVARLRKEGMTDDDTTLVSLEWDADDPALYIIYNSVTTKRHRHGHGRNR